MKLRMTKVFLQDRIVILAVFFFCSLFLRLLGLDRDVFGDESYYYYLSRFPSEYITLILTTLLCSIFCITYSQKYFHHGLGVGNHAYFQRYFFSRARFLW
jgi:hypothetical protein